MAPESRPVPRSEHPRPRLRRERWVNLNGAWEFAIDPPGAGPTAAPRTDFDRTILVPFAPESRASGIGERGFIPSVWYRRRVAVPAEWAGAAPVLRIGAADYRTRVFVDGVLAMDHWGGSTRIDVDLSRRAGPGDAVEVVVHCLDDVRTGLQPGGKQSSRLDSYQCFYTRVTGVWQTVWLEAVPHGGLEDLNAHGSAATRTVHVTPRFRPSPEVRTWRVRLVADDGTLLATAVAPAQGGVPLALHVPDARPWSPSDPALYDLDVAVLDEAGRELDRVSSYVGLRDVSVRGGEMLLNGAPVRQALVLDQGYWPETLWTAPSDDALRRDVELGQALGFDGARLHQKVFEPRYHYWADRLGYLTWAESASWGLDLSSPEAARNFLSEWATVVAELRSHPSIVAWSPFNETDPAVARDPQHHRTVADAAALTRALDPTRPVNDASGWVHVDPDLWTVHHYTQDPAELDRLLAPYPDVVRNEPDLEPPFAGQPLIVDEFGGIKWIPEGDVERPQDWGYGTDPADEAAFLARLQGLFDAVRRYPHVAGWCYTQLTDVEQERNGLLDADRRPKFPIEVLRGIVRGAPG